MLRKSGFLIFIMSLSGIILAQQGLSVDTVFNSPAKKTITNIFHYTVSGNDTLKEGSALYYYSTGALWQTGYYHNNAFDSTWTTYYPVGTVKRIAHYKGGRLNGPVVNYYDNGMVNYEGVYKDDSLTGEMKFYEVQKYIIESNHGIFVSILVASESWFKGLPRNIQDIIIDASKGLVNYAVKIDQKNDQEWREKIKKNKGTENDELPPENGARKEEET